MLAPKSSKSYTETTKAIAAGSPGHPAKWRIALGLVLFCELPLTVRGSRLVTQWCALPANRRYGQAYLIAAAAWFAGPVVMK
jgi:hypothetical protein